MALNLAAARAVPRHVAIIMDGNRRWAAAHQCAAVEGHRAGVKALRAAVRGALGAGVPMLTVYGFSTENWRRPRFEVEALMKLCAVFALNERAQLMEQGVSVRVVGDVTSFSFAARSALGALVRATARNSRLQLNLALNYGGRSEILSAARRIAADVERGRLRARDVTDETLRARLYDPNLPDPDLLIRTGGDYRLSNFLLYQVAYTELMTLPVLWPDFDEDAFSAALTAYGERYRRFGA